MEMDKVYIDKSVIQYMNKEIEKISNKNIETGGIILGRNNEKEKHIIISHVVDGGHRAEREKKLFKKDIKYSKKIEKKIFEKYGFYYIGDWHTHPNNNINYSKTDKDSMIDISNHNIGHKMIFIIAGNSINTFKIYHYNRFNKKIEELIYEVTEIEKLML